MRRECSYPEGVVHRFPCPSRALKENPLGDPCQRLSYVYTPYGWTREGPRLPLLVGLSGYASSGIKEANWRAFGETLSDRLDRLIGQGRLSPVVVACPDCYTRLGGSQYLNSVGIGRYADYLIEDAVPAVEREFHCGGTGRRGVFGKSSGGFGALWHGMHYPDFWSAVVSCAGDSAFEVAYLPSLYASAHTFSAYGMSAERLIMHIETSEKPSQADMSCLMLCALAAAYDPDPRYALSVRFPIDPHTGTLIQESWNNWLRHDPAVIAANRVDSLRQLRGVWLECGTQDEFNLHFGARRISAALTGAGIEHEYHEFECGHFNINWRFDHFLPWLARVVSG